MANVYVFEVPYTETVYGYSEYRIDATSEEVAKEILNSEHAYKYFWNNEQTSADWYEEDFSKAEICEVLTNED